MKSILVLENDLLVVRYIRAVLQPLDFETVAASNAAAAYASFARAGGFDLLLVDVGPRSSGAETILGLRDRTPGLPVVVMSTSSPDEWRPRDAAQIESLPAESVSYLWKPFLPDALVSTVKRMLG